jgi:ABC-type multidrug transport system fused ATPase/permease subunit
MDIAFFHDMFPGQVASRLGQVSGAVQRELVLAVDMVPRFAIQFVGSAALLGALAWPLAIPVVAWIAANILLAVKAMPIYAKRSAGVAKTSSKSVGAMADIYGNIQTVKLFAAEDSEAGAIRTVIADAINAQHTESRAFIVTDQIVYVLNAMLTVAALGIGIWGLTASVITVGDFVAAIAIVRNLSGSSGAFIGLGQSFSRSIGTIRDALPILSTEPAVVDRPGASALQVVRGGIDFEDVGFFYRQNQPVIEDLSLHIAPGEKLGLVGLSGAGKTTLTNLLLRLYDVTNGTIAIDGHDIAGVTQASLRAQIGVITQDVAMFNRSILDNIRYGKPDASREAVIAAARLAEADAFISGLTDSEGRIGYDAFVGDRGVKLSGGQRQRVAIARVLLKDAPILVLDEATSALDSEAEAAIQDNLERLMAGKTVLAIAHRLSTVRHMDRIAVLEKGRIVELDTPENLIAAGGLFARLWQRQTGGFLPERDEADAMQDAGPVRQRRLREQNG